MSQSLTFENAKVIANGARRPTLQTEGLLVTGEVKGMHLQQAFGTESLVTINMGFAQVFSATDKYFGKPLN
jgi:hypothetical protein